MTLGLAAGLVLAYPEIRAIWTPEQDWSRLSGVTGTVTVILYALLLLAGLMLSLISIWRGEMPGPLAKQVRRFPGLRWLAALLIAGFIAWTYLFSPWQAALSGPWTQFLFALVAAGTLSRLFEPGEAFSFRLKDWTLATCLFLYPRMVQEVRVIYPNPWLSRAVIAGGALALLAVIAVLYGLPGQRLRARLIKGRAWMGRWAAPLAGLLLLAPFLYRYALGAGGYILYPNIRFAVLLIALYAAGFLLSAEADGLVSLRRLALCAGVLVLVSAVTRSLLLVVDDPFSLSWSEGNRFYDYSLVFGNSLYNHPGRIINPYNTPGRYGLWGVLFLWRGLPIWAHRLWNVVLLTAPSLILGWAFTRKLQPAFLRQAMFLWIAAFFIILAPLHPPFMIVAIIVALFAFHPSPYVRGAALVAASLYAGVSRWTWVFAPGVWGALTDLLLYYPSRGGNWLRRLLPTAAMALLGALPGFLLNIGNFLGYSTGDITTARQPLLWYRLLPNPTLGPGIVLLTVLTTAPLIALLIYMQVSRRWRWDLFQTLAVWGSICAFLGAGLVISTKIGGGGDLHNLDMFIATLFFAAVLGLAGASRPLDAGRWPALALALLSLLLLMPVYQFTPFYGSAAYHPWLDLPAQEDMDATLGKIRAAVDQYSRQGEVLFMDQRQLLTFGYVEPIPFVAEYEKKYMMDQALASNQAYFRPYYADLAARRFKLIVTEPLKVNLKGQSGVFSEENDLWVTWVSAPTLCFYEPIMTDKSVGVQMLVPRENPMGCEKYFGQVDP
ncbi:MAG: hypothetical protein ACM3QS_02985 [Bacteroidota bacterium]